VRAADVHERRELQIFQQESVHACVRKKFEVGFRGGFCKYTNPLKSTLYFCRFLFAAEKERKIKGYKK
jgi:hypothetical protein